MTLYDAYRCDAQAEADGIWFAFDGDFRLRIARAGGANVEFLKALAEASATVLKDSGDESSRRAMAEIYARTIIKAVEGDGFVDRDGTAIAPGSDQLVDALIALPEFFTEVVSRATNRRFYLAGDIDEGKP